MLLSFIFLFFCSIQLPDNGIELFKKAMKMMKRGRKEAEKNNNLAAIAAVMNKKKIWEIQIVENEFVILLRFSPHFCVVTFLLLFSL